MTTRSREKWEDIIAAFEEDLFDKQKSHSTMASYGSTLRSFGAFYRQSLKKPGPYVSRLQEADLEAFVDYLRSSRYQALNTINRTISALRAFAQFMLEKRWHRRNIAQGLKTSFVAPSVKHPRLTASEVRRLLAAVNPNSRNGLRDLAIMQLMLQCGLRVGEISRIAMDDVMLHGREAHIRIRDGKTERRVPLKPSVKSALRKYLNMRGTVLGDDPLFLSQKGNRISTKRVQYLAKQYLCAAGRSDLSGRDLRHHLARGLYEKNKDLGLVQQVLGHRHISTTARYVHPSREEIARALEGLPENVFPDDSPREPEE